MCSFGPVSGPENSAGSSPETSSSLGQIIARKAKSFYWVGIEAAVLLTVTMLTSVFLLVEGLRLSERLDGQLRDRDRPLMQRPASAPGQGPIGQDGRPLAGLFTLGLLGKFSAADLKPVTRTPACEKEPAGSGGIDEAARDCD